MTPFALALAVQPAPTTATPLFASQDVLPVVLEGPITATAGDHAKPSPRPATLTAAGETIPLELSARGITRRQRDICNFPPLRLDFKPWPTAGLFAGQRRLKLVTHCRTSAAHTQHVLLEYAAYRMYNALTPLSFRVRPLAIEYRDSKRGSMGTRFGFLIEDQWHVAQRGGLKHFKAPDRVSAALLSPTDSARAALFNYMIGNLDWSMRAGPEGEGCCHNFRLVDRGGAMPMVPLPYDFDFSGLVDAPYASPPEAIPVSSVRMRMYRGYCAHNPSALRAATQFRARRPAIEATLSELPELSAATRAKALAYLAGFWAEIADDATTQAKVLKSCVR